jgi:hypothetical protein
MITAKDIQTKLNTAIKQFGEYTYYDKGASEIIDVEFIANQLYVIEDTIKIVSILKKLDEKDTNGPLISELIGMLMENYETGFADELAEKGEELISKYY